MPFTPASSAAPLLSASSSSSSSRPNTLSAAARAEYSSLVMLAISLMGPENLREYSTKEEICPRVMFPSIYRKEPNMAIRHSPRLLMKFTEGPMVTP